jgi:DNA-directed RNA polymerase II subunit RPB2
MSNTNTSKDYTFDSNLTKLLLSSAKPKDINDKIQKVIDVSDKEINTVQTFKKEDEFKDTNILDLSWRIYDNYFSGSNRLTQHHIDSYNHFITNIIPKMIRDYNPIIVKANYNSSQGKYMDEYHITFGDVSIGKPSIKETDGRTKLMYPNEARLRHLTYSADLYVDIYQKSIRYSTVLTEPPIIKEYPAIKKESLNRLPSILKGMTCPLSQENGISLSNIGECEFDKGGYFIIKGLEKVIICQERKCENKILSFSHNKTQTAYSHTVEINSLPPNRSFIRLTQLKLYKKESNRTIQVFIQRFNKGSPFPLFIVFRALGITSDKDIMERILYNVSDPQNKNAFNMLKPSLEEASVIKTQNMALLYMSNYLSRLPEMKESSESEDKHRQNYVAQLLKTELFPHIGEDFLKKALFLGFMAKKIINTAMGVEKHDDRDSFLNKRITSCGPLLEDLFRNNFNKIVKDMIKDTEDNMRKGRIEEIHTFIIKKFRIGANNLENSIRYSLGTGTWGMQSKSSTSKKGIAQPLNRLSYSASISHLRRVNAPQAEKGGRVTEPRKLHGTQWGRFCPSETPDGHMVGIVKNLALMAYITIGTEPELIISIIKEYFFTNKNKQIITLILDIYPADIDTQVCIFINGDIYGCTSYPEIVVYNLLSLRRHNLIDIYTSISWVIEKQEIRINTEGGRISRPLYIVKQNRLLITLQDFKDISNSKKGWTDLILEGKIEYLDVQEEDTSMIAMYYENLLENKKENQTFVIYTHCEINPVMIFGASACTIPFAENNQGIRIMYEAAQKKQALSVYATNYRYRMDNPGQVLRFPQVPLVTTKPSKYLYERELPSGQNVIVAIACFTGFNQEDSLIMNQSSINRGLFTSMYFRTYKDSEKKNQASLEEEKFCKPIKYNPNGTLRTAGTKASSYDLLDENGFIKVGSYVKGGDVIIGKVIPLKNTTEAGPKFKDASTTLGSSSEGIVDWVYVNKDSDGYQFVKVRICSKRVPGIGDKFSSRYGQKGTIGAIYTQEDMPFTSEGVTPDIIINPAAIPSRMTIGQLLETVIGKAASINGFECDATPFSSNESDTSDKLANILQTSGFKKYGTEEMFNGRNGNKFRSKIFIGPTYYQRLKHMSKDKLHARATGPLQLLTRQPPEGRKRDGGFRFGEMERDAMLGYAAAGFLKEKMFDSSDKYSFWVCKQCGHIAVANTTKNILKCLACKDSTEFSNVQCPYSCKLFFQELQSMSITPRIFTE